MACLGPLVCPNIGLTGFAPWNIGLRELSDLAGWLSQTCLRWAWPTNQLSPYPQMVETRGKYLGGTTLLGVSIPSGLCLSAVDSDGFEAMQEKMVGQKPPES